MAADCIEYLGGSALAAYVLGALGKAEAALVERHLLGCAVCGDQVADLAEVCAKLSLVQAALVLENPALAGPERVDDTRCAPDTSGRSAAVSRHRAGGCRPS